MQKYLVVEVGTDPATATSLALAHDCCGFYTGVPESMAAQAAAEGWTLPCVLTDDGTGFISGWAPA
jgi:hypothetical protein